MTEPGEKSQIPGIGTAQPGEISVEFGRSVVRLTLRDWLIVGFIVASCFIGLPMLCESLEEAPADLDGRMPYAQSEDYWNYRRRIKNIAAADRIPIIGDSVIWGDYVAEHESLSACLNSDLPAPRFSNAGLNGAHPLALSGLVKDYASDLRNRKVLLHCNLLWMGSPERDLRSDRDVPINHTRLIPQFRPQIPSYHAPFAQRLGTLIDRSMPFFDCVTHLRTRYFEGQDLQSWSLKHPYSNPLAQFDQQSATEVDEQRHRPVPWTEQGIRPQDMPWVDLETSLQWAAWRDVVTTLRSRRNQLFVLVGPLNEHLLEEPSRERYRALRAEVVRWLADQNILHLAPDALPSEDYGDASHPLRKGYARLAQTINHDARCREWLQQ